MNRSDYSTDELLDLLESKLPQEMTDEEIASLKSAAMTTVEVREALTETLGLEHGIAAAYGVELQNIDVVFAKLDEETRSRSRGAWKVLGLLALAIVCVAAGIFAYLKSQDSPLVARTDWPEVGTQKNDNQEPSPAPPSALDKVGSGSDFSDTPTAKVPGDGKSPDVPGPTNPSDTSVAAGSKNFDPSWRVFDDPALRGDDKWSDSLQQVLQPIGGSTIRERAPVNNPQVRHVALRGTFSMLPPGHNRSIRLRMAGIERLRWSFWNGDQGVLVRYQPDESALRAFAVRRDGSRLPPGFDADAHVALDNPTANRVDSKIDSSWVDQPPPELIQGPRFSVLWQGTIRFPESGAVRLTALTAGSVAVWVDDKQVIYREAVEKAEPVQGHVWYGYAAPDKKTPRTASIRIEYTDSVDGAISLDWQRNANQAQNKWRRPEIPQHRIPATAFRTSEDPQNSEQGLSATYFSDPDKDQIGPLKLLYLVDHDRGTWLEEHETGAVDVRYEEGAVRITRGESELLTLPMRQPEQFIMETQCQLRHAAVYHLPPLKRKDGGREFVATTDTLLPADVQWDVAGDGAQESVELQTGEDGSMTLSRSSESPQWRGLTTTERRRGAEITMKLDAVSAGAGVILVDPSNTQRALNLLVAQHEGTRVLCQRPEDQDSVLTSYRSGWFVGDSFWVRLIVGLNDTRIQFSNNGQTWITAEQHNFAADRPIDGSIQFGVCGSAESSQQQIRIAALEVRRLQGLERLTSPEQIAQASERFEELDDESGDWQDRFDSLIQARPERASATSWEVACRLAMLSSAMPSQERVKHVQGLLETLVSGELDWQTAELALVELPRRFYFSAKPLTWSDLGDFYNKTALDYWPNPELRHRIPDLTDVWHRQLQIVRQPKRAMTMMPAPLDLGRLNLYALAESGDSDRLWSAAIRQYGLAINGAGELAAYRSADLSQLAQWMLLQAASPAGQGEATDAEPDNKVLMIDKGGQFSWLRSLPLFHPLRVEPYSRDSQNLMHEVRAAIDRQDWDAAAGAIIREPMLASTAAGVKNDDVLVAIDVIVREWIDRYPQLAASLQAKQQVGRVRLNRAIKHGELPLLESVALQFHLTEVGSAAEEHLADRELSMREFLRAGQRYARLAATRSAGADQLHHWNSRYRLAMALAGRAAGKPVTQPVRFSGREMSAGEFEQLIADSLKHRDLSATAVSQGNPPLAPATDSLAVAAQWSAERGASEMWNSYRRIDFGWAWQDEDIYLSQPAQLIGFNIRSNTETLKVPAPPAKDNWLSYNTRRFARPLVLGPHLIMPIYWEDRFELTCISRDTGDVVWRGAFDDNVLGEPVMCDGTVVILCLRENTAKDGTVVLRRVDPASGQSLLSKDIAQIELARGMLQAGRPLVHQDSILLRCGCGVICCDLLGKVRWIRQLPFTPHQVDWERFDDLLPGDLWKVGECVVIASPSSRNVECREIKTGTKRWVYSHPNLARVVGVAEDRVILAMRNELHAVDANSGQLVWRKPFSGNARSLLLNDAGFVIVPASDNGQVELRRLRISDGGQQDPVTVDGKNAGMTRVDRMLTDGERILCVHLPDSGRLKLTVLQPVDITP